MLRVMIFGRETVELESDNCSYRCQEEEEDLINNI